MTIYRFIFAGYCLGWIIFSGFHPANGNEKWFIYLTNWGYTFVSLYFIWATAVCLVHHFTPTSTSQEIHMKDSTGRQNGDEEGIRDSSGSDQPRVPMAWYHKALWVIDNIAANVGVVITLSYWTLLFAGTTSGLDVSTHLLNSILMLVDHMLSSTPVRIFHVVYSWAFDICYILLTVIYWAAGGTNARGEPYIYSYIDYSKSPGFAVGFLAALVLIGQPLSQALLFGFFKIRCFLQSKYGKKG